MDTLFLFLFLRMKQSHRLVNQQCLFENFECNLCDASFDGYTHQLLHQRVDEHKSELRINIHMYCTKITTKKITTYNE